MLVEFHFWLNVKPGAVMCERAEVDIFIRDYGTCNGIAAGRLNDTSAHNRVESCNTSTAVPSRSALVSLLLLVVHR